jgi:GTP-binding protein EngB required for normal cell division
MPENTEGTGMTRRPGHLNENQQTRLRITCRHIDRLLSDIDDILRTATSQSPFPRYAVNLSLAQIRVLEDYIRRFRSQLVRTMEWQGMKPEPPDIDATHAVLTHLAFVDIAIEELKPQYMRGSGPVPEDAVAELHGVVHELRSLVTGMERYLKQELGTDLEKRLQRMERSGLDMELLRSLEQIVTRNGLVEFRPRIDALASRLEDDSFEVALFGRVSCGKSSLLNAILGTAVLPVGVIPITAVPTKLRYGATLRAAASYADGRSSALSIEQLSQLVTEQGNPGNLKNVVRAVVEVPSQRLKSGILLVDTPGLGSLARRGAAETLAYLPSCDLGLLLIDAGAPLNEEDIGTLRLLYAAGIPALVLLSKSDLLRHDDLRQAASYIHEHVQSELGLDLAVHPVSVMREYSILLDEFFEQELQPRFAKATALREASVARKIGALREAVIGAIESTLERQVRRGLQLQPDTAAELESLLRVVIGEVGEERAVLDHAFRKFGETPDAVLDTVALDAAHWVVSSSETQIPALQLSEWIHETVRRSIQPYLDSLLRVEHHAIDSLQRIAENIGRNDMPSQEDAEQLLRDLPRFELAALPQSIRVMHRKIFGSNMLRSRIRRRLRDSIGVPLKEELHLYGIALSHWGEQVVRKLELLLNSYADAYRVQLHRARGVSADVADQDQMQADLELLNHWKSDEPSDLEAQHALATKEK